MHPARGQCAEGVADNQLGLCTYVPEQLKFRFECEEKYLDPLN